MAVGFLSGALTTAAGNYLADRFTDKRRDKNDAAYALAQWDDIQDRFPRVLMEMKDDVKNPEFSSVREFFVKSSRSTISREGSFFEYHTDVHDDLVAAVCHLEELGYVVDVTSGNTPMYRMTEQFIDMLRR